MTTAANVARSTKGMRFHIGEIPTRLRRALAGSALRSHYGTVVLVLGAATQKTHGNKMCTRAESADATPPDFGHCPSSSTPQPTLPTVLGICPSAGRSTLSLRPPPHSSTPFTHRILEEAVT